MKNKKHDVRDPEGPEMMQYPPNDCYMTAIAPNALHPNLCNTAKYLEAKYARLSEIYGRYKHFFFITQ